MLRKCEVNKPRVFKFNAVAVVVVAKERRQWLDVTKNPIQDVDEVTELSKQGSSVQIFGAVPAAGVVVAVVAVPEAVDVNLENVSQQALIHHGLQPFRRGRIAVLHDTKHITSALKGGVQYLFGVGLVQCHGFFDNHVGSRLNTLKCMRCVQAVGTCNGQYIHLMVR